MPEEVILWGGTGQAKVVRPIIEHYGSKVVAIFDNKENLPSPFSDVPIYHGMDGFRLWHSKNHKKELGFCVAVGNPNGRFRVSLHEQLESEFGLKPVTITHPFSFISASATLGVGSQLMAGAVVTEEAILGRQCIINTNASVDHECVLGDGTELAPGATLCGLVTTGINAWICTGATVLPRLHIGDDALAGAGSLINQNIPAGAVFVGVPGRPITRRK